MDHEFCVYYHMLDDNDYFYMFGHLFHKINEFECWDTETDQMYRLDDDDNYIVELTEAGYYKHRGWIT